MSLKIDLSVNWWKEFIGSCLPCSACYECFLKSFYLLYEILLLPSLLLRRRDGSPIARLGILNTGWIKVERTESTSGACDSHADPNFCLARVHRSLAHDCKVPVSFGSRPAKQMLFPFFYSTFDVSFRADFGQGFKIFGVLLLQGIYIFSNPEVTADCKLAACTSSLLTEFSYSNFKYNWILGNAYVHVIEKEESKGK